MLWFELRSLCLSIIILVVARMGIQLFAGNVLADGNFLILVVVPIIILMMGFNVIKFITK